MTKKLKQLIDSLTTKEIVTFAALAAISASLQLVHIGYMNPWGMWLDLVAVPWLIALFLYRGRGAFFVSCLSVIAITFTAPSSWLGAGMKWLGTLPMWLIPALYTFRSNKGHLEKIRFIVPLTAVAVLVRGLIVLPVNYYVALPIWLGEPPRQAMKMVPWQIIFSWNLLQGALEMTIAWLIAFRLGLRDKL